MSFFAGRMALVACVAAASACAFPASASAGEIKQPAPHVYVLFGASDNVVIVPAATGALVIDTQGPKDADETMSAIQQVTPGPVRFAVDTHWHADHSGGNKAFAAAGATVIAQANVLKRLSSERVIAASGKHLPPAPKAYWPTLVFDHRLDLSVGDETAHLVFTPAAHTDGDVLVKLEQANLIHMGDIFFNGYWPFIDRDSGGSVQGVLMALDAALAMSDDSTVIVPAHGPIATRAELSAYRAMIQDVADRVQALVRAGKSEDEVLKSRPAAAYHEPEGDEEKFICGVFESLKPS